MEALLYSIWHYFIFSDFCQLMLHLGACVCVFGVIINYCCVYDSELKFVYWMCQFVSLCFYELDRACNMNWHKEFMGSIVLLYHELMYSF